MQYDCKAAMIIRGVHCAFYNLFILQHKYSVSYGIQSAKIKIMNHQFGKVMEKIKEAFQYY